MERRIFMDTKKRVYCLYRVSTIGQVEKNDIPMQKDYCREFAASKPDWLITNELYEKGISGFKKSAKERDAIQQIQADAMEHKFEVLLVFMFDRLGRRDDETPFVVEWFVRNGIEVWSAMEGEQRFDNHVDKLLNYIRYWQASGESIKTAMRVKTRMEQLTEAGMYTGGTVPFGYTVEKRGRVNKRNREVYDLAIDEDAADIVRLVFHKYVYEGYGAQKLCNYLAEMNIRKPDGSGFPNTTINRIIKNPIYIGVIKNGDACSEPIPELQIIDNETYERAQEEMKERFHPHNYIPANVKTKALLSGLLYCGHCGYKLITSSGGRKKVKYDDTVKWKYKPRYQCQYKTRHPGECDGQTGYSMMKLDRIVDDIVREQLKMIAESPTQKLVTELHEKRMGLEQSKYKLILKQTEEKEKELTDLHGEMIRVIRGESRINAEILNELIDKAKKELDALKVTLEAEKEELLKLKNGADGEHEELSRILSWADVYDLCDFDTRKTFITKFIKSIHVYRDYRLEVEFNVSFDEFRNYTYKGEADFSEE